MTQPDIGCNLLRAKDALSELRDLQDLLQLVTETQNTNPARYTKRLDMVIEIYLTRTNTCLEELELNLDTARKSHSHHSYR